MKAPGLLLFRVEVSVCYYVCIFNDLDGHFSFLDFPFAKEDRQQLWNFSFLCDSPPAAANEELRESGDPLLHPPDARPQTPAKDFVLCTPNNGALFFKF